MARLVCEAGPAAGEEFPLEGDELCIGRSSDNPVSIPDTSVSRKHALVRVTRRGWALSDLGSGNGTALNGEALVEEAVLTDGDVITLGDTELRYVAAEAAPAALARRPVEQEVAPERSRRPPVRTARSGTPDRAGRRPAVRNGRGGEDPELVRQRKRKTFIRVGGALVVVSALLVGWKAIDNKRKKDAIAYQLALDAHRDEMAQMFKDAKDLVRAGKWQEAKAQLLVVQQTDPDYEPKQIANYLTIADQEIPNEAALKEATVAIASGELAGAVGALARVKSTPQSELALRGARDALDRKIADKLAAARELARAPDLASMEKLKALAEDILVARPEDRDAAELKNQAEVAIYSINNPTIAPPPPDTPWVEVQQRFRSGDATAARTLAHACAARSPRCRELEAQIFEWEAKSRRLENLGEDELVGLYELDRRIGGGSSSEQSRPIRTQLVAKLYIKASQAKTTAKWSKAIEYARKVLEADPNHGGAQSIVAEARAQAREVYLRAYQLKETSPDEAEQLFKDVVKMTPSDDEYNQKARSRLAELQHQ